jgi:O-antigen/teichoic acid export membrane protein
VPNIIYVGVISVALALVTFAINLGYTKKLLPEVQLSPKFFEMKSIMEIMSSSLWNSVNQIGSILMFSLSIVFCNVLISTEAGGEYSIIQTIPNFINGIISTLASVFIPSVTQTYATKSISEVVDEVKMSQKFMGIITNIPIVVFMVIGTEFYQLWVPGENAQRLHILSILTVFHLLFIGVTWTINNLNTVINKVKVPALYLLGSGMVNIVLVLLLTRFTNLGIYAIPISSASILLVWSAVFIPTYPCKVLKLKWNTFYGAIYKMLISSVILFAVASLLRILFPIHSWFTLIGFCAVAGVMGLMINLFLVLNKQDRQQFLHTVRKKLKR